MKKNIIIALIAIIVILLTTIIVMYSRGYKNNDIENTKQEETEKEDTQEDQSDVIEQNEPVANPSDEYMPIEASYDVIVFGAEPEGIAATISAARNGLKVF